ncbi:MAG: nucleotidyltransferase [Chitinophagales bacterium]
MFHKDYKEFIQLLIEKDAEYLIVGGHAVILYGYPRFTNDLDVWINPTEENAAKVIDCLKEFGMASLGIQSKDLTKKGNIIQLGHIPVRIDLLNEIDGVKFDSCYKNKEVVEVYGMKVNFLHLTDLEKNKLASGRKKDLADLEEIKRKVKKTKK